MHLAPRAPEGSCALLRLAPFKSIIQESKKTPKVISFQALEVQ